MGWLQEQMTEMETPALGFLELAERLKHSRHWPKSDGLKPSSLGSYLGRLDKGDATWLEKRPGVRKALADVLGMPLEELEERLRGNPSPRGEVDGRISLWDLGTSVLELRREPLPPGIPPAAYDPRQWPRWWRASSGSGRTLVGRWLEARGLATFIQEESWARAEPQLPTRGAIFVELTLTSDMDSLPLNPPPNLAICIAANAPPPAREQEDPFGTRTRTASEWPVVVHQQLDSWLPELVSWAAARLSPGEDFNIKDCLAWMYKVPVELGLIDGFGAALGLVGLYAELGGRRAGRGRRPLDQVETLSGLARLFLRMRLRQRGLEGTIHRDPLWEGLSQLACGLLVRSESAWDAPRSLGEWRSLAVSRPDAVDLRWLEELAAQGKLKLDPTELKQLQSASPPDTFRTVHFLQELRLLYRESPDQFVIRPRWFLAAIIDQARASLLNAGWRDWGAALLRRHAAPLVIAELIDRCTQGDFVPIQQALEAPARRDPAWVAAVECAFRALGITLLQGGSVPEALQLELFRVQLQLMVERWGHPMPRIDYSNVRDEAPLLEHGLWFLAAFALSESIVERLPAEASMLVPWTGKVPPESLKIMLTQAVSSCLQTNQQQELQLGALALGERLLEKLGPLRTTLSEICEFQHPAWLLEHFRRGQLSWDHFRDEFRTHRVMPLLRSYVEHRQVDWHVFARTIWMAWLDSPRERRELPQLFWVEQPWASDLWEALPVEVFRVMLERYLYLFSREKGAHRHLQAEHWNVFVSSWAQLRKPGHDPDHTTLWANVPTELLPRAMAPGLLDGHDHTPHQELWKRIPDLASAEISRRIGQGLWDEALRLAWYAPPDWTAEVAERLSAGLARKDAARPRVVEWAHDRVSQRPPGWERAWELLTPQE